MYPSRTVFYSFIKTYQYVPCVPYSFVEQASKRLARSSNTTDGSFANKAKDKLP